jgi:hypothetical protein
VFLSFDQTIKLWVVAHKEAHGLDEGIEDRAYSCYSIQTL